MVEVSSSNEIGDNSGLQKKQVFGLVFLAKMALLFPTILESARWFGDGFE